MAALIIIFFIIFLWIISLRHSYKKLQLGRPLQEKPKVQYNLADVCPKRRGEAALCGYCPLFDPNTGECARGRWRS